MYVQCNDLCPMLLYIRKKQFDTNMLTYSMSVSWGQQQAINMTYYPTMT